MSSHVHIFLPFGKMLFSEKQLQWRQKGKHEANTNPL